MKSTRKISHQIVTEYLKKHRIPERSSIIAAFSGGPDSMAMAAILSSLGEYNFKIICAYFNHNLRDSSELVNEIAAVKQQAARLNLKIVIGEAGPGLIKKDAGENKKSLEEAARDSRYAFLYKIKNEFAADFIAVGHNLEDNAETMLMRFILNAGINGLSGIPDKRDCIIRPVIGLSRQLIENYLGESGLTFCVDSTNKGLDFMRNRLRRKVIPPIVEQFPDFISNMTRLSEKIELNNQFVANEAESRLKWIKVARGWKIEKRVFFREPLLLRIRSLYSITEKIPEQQGRVRYSALKAAAEGGIPESGKILLRTGYFELVCMNDDIFIQRLVNRNKKSYLLRVKPDVKIPVFGQILQFMLLPDGLSAYESEPAAAVCFPLIVRSFREGDKIFIKDGKKSIKKLFNEWSVTPDDRQLLPIVEDSEGIVAVIGCHLGYENKTAYGRNLKGKEHTDILMKFIRITETTGE